MATINLENWVYTERKVPVQNASIVIKRSDTGATVGTATSGVDGHWGPVAVDMTGWPGTAYPDVEWTYGSQVRVDKGGAQVFIKTINTATTLTGVTLSDPFVTGQASTVGVNQTLPTLASSSGKWRFYKATASITISKDAGDAANCVWGPGAIAGANSFTMGNGDSVAIFCDGTTWKVF